MSNNDGHASIHDYLSDFQQLLERELPEELPGSVATANLIGEYVHSDKRRILLFIQTSPTHALRVQYRMPVPANGARLFNGEGLMPHTEPTFGTVAIVGIPAAAAAAGMRDWNDEIARLTTMRDTHADAGYRRKAKNVLIYWNLMRPLIRTAVRGVGVRTSSASSSSVSAVSSSSNRSSGPRSYRSSSARSSSRATRGRSSNRRMSPYRSTSDPRDRRRTRSRKGTNSNSNPT